MTPSLLATLQETDGAKTPLPAKPHCFHARCVPKTHEVSTEATRFGGCGSSQSKASLQRACLDLPAPATHLLFGEPIARVAVVVDPMLFLQFLNVPKRCLRMRPDAIVSMQQHLLQTAIHAHALVLGQILE
jgi:hypothetical protein